MKPQQRTVKTNPSWHRKAADFWKDFLNDLPLSVSLAQNQLPKGGTDLKVRSYDFSRSAIDSQAVKTISKKYRTTPFTLLAAAYGIVLSRYSGQTTLLFTYPVHMRSRGLQSTSTPDLFINHVPLKLELPSGLSFRELVVSLDKQQKAVQPYLGYDLKHILRQLGRQDEAYGNVGFAASDLDTEALKSDDITQGVYDLCLLYDIKRKEGGRFRVDYKTSVLDQALVRRWAGHFERVLQSGLKYPDKKIGDIGLLSTEEYQETVYDWNATEAPYPEDKPLHALFEAQVAKGPNQIALVCEEAQLTYGELNARANQVARAIRNTYQEITGESLQPDTLIALLVERSLEMVIGMLGVLKAGGGYVPIDPAYPQERIQYMLSDTEAKILLTQSYLPIVQAWKDKTGASAPHLLYLDQPASYAQEETTDLDPMSGPRDLAYVIYTSGSTGKPKGTLLTHKSVSNLVANKIILWNLSRSSKVLQFAAVGFDALISEVYPTLVVGGSLYIPYDAMRKAPTQLGKYIQQNQLHVATIPPTLLEQFPRLDLPSLQVLVVAGEPCQQAVMEYWSQGRTLLNAYGPTETAVCATMHKFKSGDLNTNIGKSLANVCVYALDMHHQPVPVGVPGELYIGGAGVAKGYLNQPELTAERFIANPFASEADKAQGKNLRLYKTGDLVKWQSDGNLIYLGRTDFQVKLRGYRIELGEIEAVLAGYPGLGQVAVVLQAEADQQLVAYYVLEGDTGSTTVTPETLRDYLQSKLPGYMVPSFFVLMDQLPMTVNGKLDRRALPKPDIVGQIAQGYVGPSNEAEQLLQDIWQEVLGLDQIGVYDHFFHIGGHSLKATQVAARIQQTLAKPCLVKWLFDFPTIKSLAERLQGNQTAEVVTIPHLGQKEGALSYAQQRLWFIDQYQNQQSANYHIPVVLQLRGDLQVRVLEESLNQLLERHHSLRTVFRQDASGNAYQVILPMEASQISLSVEEVSEQACQQHIVATIEEPFDLATERLFRVRLFAVKNDRGGQAGKTTYRKEKNKKPVSVYRLVIVQHHIISDGWSMGVWVRELSALYNALVKGDQAYLPELPIQYIDYSAWEQAYLQGEKLQKLLAYWEKQLSGYEDLQLPTDKPRPPIQTYEGAYIPFHLDVQLTDQLRGLARESGSTLYMVLLAGLSLVLSRYSSQEDIVIGSPIANRWHSQLENLIGFFVNTLVLRVKTGSQSVRDLLRQVKQTTLAAYEHQALPFEHLVEQLGVERDQSRAPIFQVMLAWEHASDMIDLSLSGVEIEALPVAYDVSKFDITLSLQESEEGIVGGFEYNPALFHTSTIERLGVHLQRLLEAMVYQPEGDVTSLPLLTSAEYQQLVYAWNATEAVYPQDQTVQSLFEAQVAKAPNQIALVFEEEQLTYGALNARANQVARAIRKTYQEATGEVLKPDTVIALMVERSLEMVVGMLGVLKAGGAYVPIDPAYPKERIEFMLSDTEAKILLTQSHLPLVQEWKDTAKASTLHLLYLDQPASYAQEEATSLPPMSGPQDLAYVIYTSGSTGKPKGVMIEHQSVVNYSYCFIDYASITETDIFSLLFSYSFDGSVAGLISPLLAGTATHILSKECIEQVDNFREYTQKKSITVLDIPPNYFYLLISHDQHLVQGVRKIILGGESVRLSDTRSLLLNCPHISIFNEYGPTETTVGALQARITVDETTNNIGKPLANVCVYVLDVHRQPVPVGVPGELYIGGAGVAKGYLNRPELTAERFIVNPFASEADKAQGKNLRLYKTGDLVKWQSDGNLIYLGRTDFQVKLRGYRIELGEIEAVLASHPSMAQAAVVMQEDEDQQQLVAYYVLEGNVDTAEVTTEKLRSYLQTRLPDYMVPSFFVQLEQLPMTVNGKLDRKALPKPDVSGQIEERYVEPRTETERKLCEVWEVVLGLDRVGIHDHFFHIGGDSIKSIQIVAQARQKDLALQVADIFSAPTIAQLAIKVQPLSISQVDQGLAQGICSLLPIQKWFFAEQYTYPHHWNQAQMLKIQDKIEVDQLRIALDQLVQHHDSLRLRYRPGGFGTLEQYYDNPATSTYVLSTLDLSDIPTTHQEQYMVRWNTTLQGSLNHEQGPVMAVGLIQGHADGEDRLLLAIHHLMVDGVSWRILLPDLQTLYTRGKLPAKTHSYQAWAQALITYAQDKAIDALAYWKSVEGQAVAFKLPYKSRTHATQPVQKRAVVGLVLSSELTKQLLHNTAHAYNTQINDLLLTAFALALNSVSGKANDNEHVVGFQLEGHGREQIDTSVDLSRTIGWFTSIYPVCLSLLETEDLHQLIPSIKEQLRTIPDKGLSYGTLAYLHPDRKVRDQLQPEQLPRIVFNYLGQFDQAPAHQSTAWQLIDDLIGEPVDLRNHAPNHLDVNGGIWNQQLSFTLAYSLSHFTAKTIQDLQEQFEKYLTKVISHCVEQKEAYATPSDYPLLIDIY